MEINFLVEFGRQEAHGLDFAIKQFLINLAKK